MAEGIERRKEESTARKTDGQRGERIEERDRQRDREERERESDSKMGVKRERKRLFALYAALRPTIVAQRLLGCPFFIDIKLSDYWL